MILVNKCQLKQFYQECQKDKYIAIDTEFYWTETYRAIPCLIQISNSKRSILIDLIAAKIDLYYLKKILSNTKIVKVFHSARQDLEIFFNLFNELPNPIFDTQIGVLPLGYDFSVSLEKLCKDYIAIKLLKENQRLDWRSRPLNKRQIQYALNDVKYLYIIYKKIVEKLHQFKRFEWTFEYHKKLLDINIYSNKEKLAWKKIRYNPKFNIELILLKKISELREKEAMNLNVPAKKVISDNTLIKLCENKINVFEKTKILRKLDNLKITVEIIKLFKKIKNKKINLLSTTNLNKDQKRKYKELKDLLFKTSILLKISPNLIANKAELENLIKGNPSELLKGWKYDVFGKKCKRLL